MDADLLLIWTNNFQLCFRFHLASCPVLPAVLIISRGECVDVKRAYMIRFKQSVSLTGLIGFVILN